MKEIILTQGKVALVDDWNYERIITYGKWRVHKSKRRNVYYAVHGQAPFIFMHHLILPCETNQEVDHKDGDGLNNQESNLRHADNFQQNWNRGPNKNHSLKGVFLMHNGRFEAKIMVRRTLIRLGYFNTKEEAALAYNEAARKYHGEFAYQNTIPAQTR